PVTHGPGSAAPALCGVREEPEHGRASLPGRPAGPRVLLERGPRSVSGRGRNPSLTFGGFDPPLSWCGQWGGELLRGGETGEQPQLSLALESPNGFRAQPVKYSASVGYGSRGASGRARSSGP